MHEYPSDKTRRLAGLLAGNVFSTKMELDRMIARAPEAMKMGHEVAIGSLLQWQIVLNRYDTATRPVYDAVMARSTFKDGPRLRRQIELLDWVAASLVADQRFVMEFVEYWPLTPGTLLRRCYDDSLSASAEWNALGGTVEEKALWLVRGTIPPPRD